MMRGPAALTLACLEISDSIERLLRNDKDQKLVGLPDTPRGEALVLLAKYGGDLMATLNAIPASER